MASKKLIIGIDPGQKGAIVAATHKMELEDFYDFTGLQMRDIIPILRSYGPNVRVFIEEPIMMPGQNVKAVATRFKDYGMLLGALETLCLEFFTINPRTWTSSLHKGFKGDSKNKSRQVFKVLFPKVDGVVLNDGIIDAALIAYYGHSSIHLIDRPALHV